MPPSPCSRVGGVLSGTAGLAPWRPGPLRGRGARIGGSRDAPPRSLCRAEVKAFTDIEQAAKGVDVAVMVGG